MTVQCSNCKAPLIPGTMICPSCGSPTPVPVTSSPPAPEESAAANVSEEMKEPTGSSTSDEQVEGNASLEAKPEELNEPKVSPASDEQAKEEASGEANDGLSTEARLGRALGENYEVRRMVGRGGFAEVYEVWDIQLDRRLAAKVMNPEIAWTPGNLLRFKQEARTVAQLTHPSILPIHFVGDREDLVYFVMPYVEGESVKEQLYHGVMAVDAGMSIVVPVLQALDHAHGSGLVHRDIKPDNIMTDKTTGRVLLLDFGIAKAMDPERHQNLTQVGFAVGTPHYMSPEQILGDKVDHRADIYAFGVTMFEMFTGKKPFTGETAQDVITKHVSDEIHDPRSIQKTLPGWLSWLIVRCLQKKPGDRFQSAQGILNAIARKEEITDTPSALDIGASGIVQGSGMEFNTQFEQSLPPMPTSGEAPGDNDPGKFSDAPTQVSSVMSEPLKEGPAVSAPTEKDEPSDSVIELVDHFSAQSTTPDSFENDLKPMQAIPEKAPSGPNKKQETPSGQTEAGVDTKPQVPPPTPPSGTPAAPPTKIVSPYYKHDKPKKRPLFKFLRAVFILTVLGAGSGWFALGQPKTLDEILTRVPLPARNLFVVQNALATPVVLTINGKPGSVLQPQGQDTLPFWFKTPEVRWSMDLLRDQNGQEMGQMFEGTVAAIVEMEKNRFAQLTAQSTADPIFAPMVTNRTGRDLIATINPGTPIETSCGCLIPAGAIDMRIGYYLLIPNAVIRFQRVGQGGVPINKRVDPGAMNSLSGAISITVP